VPPAWGPRLKKTLADKKPEFWLTALSLAVTAGCLVLGYYLFLHSGPNNAQRWWGAFFDRIATAAPTTAAVATLSVFFYFRDLTSKYPIHWD
jgi:hypothetical protein